MTLRALSIVIACILSAFAIVLIKPLDNIILIHILHEESALKALGVFMLFGIAINLLSMGIHSIMKTLGG
jgi:hypothetical protein